MDQGAQEHGGRPYGFFVVGGLFVLGGLAPVVVVVGFFLVAVVVVVSTAGSAAAALTARSLPLGSTVAAL